VVTIDSDDNSTSTSEGDNKGSVESEIARRDRIRGRIQDRVRSMRKYESEKEPSEKILEAFEESEAMP
jgi:hypothetical protein